MATDLTLKFSASNLGYTKCTREAWLRARGIKFPGGMFSAAVREMEKAQNDRFAKCESLHSLCDEFPNGKVVASNKRPSTLPFLVEGVNVVLSGQYNYLVELKEGDYALLAFKSSDPTRNIDAITTQLNALAYILANHKNCDERMKVVKLGVVVFDTNAFDRGDSFYSFYPVELNIDKFESDLAEIVKSVSGTELPDYCGCEWCKFMAEVKTIEHELVTREKELVTA